MIHVNLCWLRNIVINSRRIIIAIVRPIYREMFSLLDLPFHIHFFDIAYCFIQFTSPFAHSILNTTLFKFIMDIL